MSLKNTVDKILKDKGRSLSWLAKSIGRTVDGLRLAIKNESIKYKDIIAIANLLKIHPGTLFIDTERDDLLSEPKSEYMDSKMRKVYDQLLDSMTDQLADKDRIIALLEERNSSAAK